MTHIGSGNPRVSALGVSRLAAFYNRLMSNFVGLNATLEIISDLHKPDIVSPGSD